ncbi:MAG: cytochrome c-type biogenesis protein [Robiginitomaculum sp.]
MKTIIVLFALSLSFSLSGLAHGQNMQGNADLESRAREIGKSLRCVVCQNESIEESNASLAADMRVFIRERLAAGDSNEAIIATMQNRYGDYVLLDPPVQANTYILWFGPALLLLGSFAWYLFRAKRKTVAVKNQPLSEEEQKRLDDMLAEGRK